MDYKLLAADWINAWNNRDIDSIMKHYADDVEFHSPTVIKRWNIADGKLIGKEKLKQHYYDHSGNISQIRQRHVRR